MGMSTGKRMESVVGMNKPGLRRYWCSAWRQAKRRQAIARSGAVLRDFGNRNWGRIWSVWGLR